MLHLYLVFLGEEGKVKIRLIAAFILITLSFAKATPLVSGEFDLALQWYGNADMPQWVADVAWGDGTGLVVWEDSRLFVGAIYGTRFGTGGEVIDPVGIPILFPEPMFDRYLHQPRLSWDGTYYLLALKSTDNNFGEAMIEAVMLDSAARPVVPKTITLSRISSFAGQHAVASSGQEHLVAWVDIGNGIFIQRIDTDFSMLDDSPLQVSGPAPGLSGIDVGWDGQHYVVFWKDENGVRAARIEQRGEVLDAGGIALIDGEINAGPRVAWTGEHYLLVFAGHLSIFQQFDGILAMRVSPDLGLLDVFPATLDNVTSTNPDIACGSAICLVSWDNTPNSPGKIMGALVDGFLNHFDPTIGLSGSRFHRFLPAACWDGSEFLVTWTEMSSNLTFDVYATRVDAFGNVSDRLGYPLSLGHSNQLKPSAVFDGENFLAVWSEGRGERGMDIVGRHISPGSVAVSPPAAVLEAAPLQQMQPRLSRNVSGYLLTWCDWRNYSENKEPFMTRLGADGIPIDQARRFSGDCGVPVACGSSRCLVPKVTDSDVQAVFIDMETDIPAEEVVQVRHSSANPSSAAVSWGAGRFLLAWTECSVFCTVHAARLSDDGKVLDPTGFQLSPTEGYHGSPIISWDGENFLVAWVDNESRIDGARVEPDGEVLDPEGFHIGEEARKMYLQGAAGGTGRHLVAWLEEYEPDLWRVRAARIGREGQALDMPPILLVADVQKDWFAPAWHNALSSDGRGRWLYTYSKLHDEQEEPLVRAYGVWLTALAPGQPCQQAGECESGYCVDGLCCDSTCQGQCEACNEPGAEGTCVSVQGAPHGDRPACVGIFPCGGVCDGSHRQSCSYPGPEVLCAESRCENGVEAKTGFCNGTGACSPQELHSCWPYYCGGNSCRDSCSDDVDCADDLVCREGNCRQEQDGGPEPSHPADGCGCSTSRGISDSLICLLACLALLRACPRNRRR